MANDPTKEHEPTESVEDVPVAPGEADAAFEGAEREHPAEDESMASTFGRHARRHVRRAWDHLWGPTGSIILHVLLLYALVHWITFAARDVADEFDVQMVEIEGVDLDELVRELEQLPEIEIDMAMPDADITLDAPPDVQQRDVAVTDEFTALDIRSEASPLVMRGLFAARDAEGRTAMLRRFAGTRATETEAAVLRALEWLKRNQQPNGAWQGASTATNRAGMTGLGLLTFLAHGETPTSERYGETVEKAIRFLINDQNPQTGLFRSAGAPHPHREAPAYAHGMATYALAEAYALTRIPTIRPALERALRRIVEAQAPSGGIRYALAPTDTQRDTSLMSWMGQAMKAAYIGGVVVEGMEETMERLAGAIKLNFAPDNRFAYAPGGLANPMARPDRGVLSNTAQAVLALQLLGHGGSAEAQTAAREISELSCEWGSAGGMGTWPLYNWYYHTQAMFHHSERVFHQWNRQFSIAYLGAQRRGGEEVSGSEDVNGSWIGFTDREFRYGPVYGTTFAALTLMVYYRNLPTYQPIEIEPQVAPPAEEEIIVEIL